MKTARNTLATWLTCSPLIKARDLISVACDKVFSWMLRASLNGMYRELNSVSGCTPHDMDRRRAIIHDINRMESDLRKLARKV
ncbi:hypothetical protein GN109_05710 [Collimonas pratensis]|uniref:hypothetical protein n=1 Tax=Collimonas pratensis TaxID=279113 RepID=UPI00143D1DFB|nr:hypothetical protein [Collimonas pratensis]NKI68910.1 hypothetical protein [Collimonas pratensis]